MATHQPGDIFSLTSTTALAWTLTYWGASNATRAEFASNIYAHSGGGYFFGTPISGTARRVYVPDITPGNTSNTYTRTRGVMLEEIATIRLENQIRQEHIHALNA